MNPKTEQKIRMLIEHYQQKNLSDSKIFLLIQGIFLQCEENDLKGIFEKQLGMRFEEISEQVEMNLYQQETEEVQFIKIEIPTILLKGIQKENWQNYVCRLIKEDRGL